jgi:putative ABC transport system permease protein
VIHALTAHPQIVSASVSTGLLTDIGWGVGPSWEGKPQNENAMFFKLGVDFNYLNLHEMEMAYGRAFSHTFFTDSENAVILNEEALKITGWKNPIGKRFDGGSVIGIIKNFHFESVREKIKPIFFRIMRNHEYCFFLSIKIKSDDIPATIAFINRTWKKFSPDYPFSYTFLDQAIDRLYRTDRRIGKALSCFSLMAVIIACLGLFGLISFTIEQRTKEIGIRKVMGASVWNIVTILNTEFTKWIILANLVAWPAAYFIVNRWLQNFAYRTRLEGWPFVLSVAITLLLSLLTISYHSIRAAVANPVESLRYE